MNKDLRKILTETVGKELNNNKFYLVDSSNKHFIYHRKNSSIIEIVQIAKDKYETYITVSVSVAFFNAVKEHTNINYPFLKEFSHGDYDKISVDDCIEKYFLKGNIGDSFHYGDVYLTLGRGLIGVSPNGRKPFGIKVKSFKKTTYSELCNLIIKRLEKAYCWLERKQSVK